VMVEGHVHINADDNPLTSQIRGLNASYRHNYSLL